MTQQEAETALDGGKLFVAMANGNWWKARRNGKTQTWKTRPGEYSIPIKYGLRGYGRFDQTWNEGYHYRIEA